MKLSNIANVIDLEHDTYRIIEIGLTTIDLQKREILTKYSLPVDVDFEVSKEITQLTGWTPAKLKKQGLQKEEILRRLIRYGITNRLLITDCSNEIDLLENFLEIKCSTHRLNVSILFSLLVKEDPKNLEQMLKRVNLNFSGRVHNGADDSYNIARLFLEVLK